jgi:hypothetical protein
MDDHHQQPVWPMIQGAANYAWNLVEEAWAFVWKPAEQQQTQTMQITTGNVAGRDGAAREVSEPRVGNTQSANSATITDVVSEG